MGGVTFETKTKQIKIFICRIHSGIILSGYVLRLSRFFLMSTSLAAFMPYKQQIILIQRQSNILRKKTLSLHYYTLAKREGFGEGF